jgi:hypothetical protein
MASKAPKFKPLIDLVRRYQGIADISSKFTKKRNDIEVFVLSDEIRDEAMAMFKRAATAYFLANDTTQCELLKSKSKLPYPSVFIEFGVDEEKLKQAREEANLDAHSANMKNPTRSGAFVSFHVSGAVEINRINGYEDGSVEMHEIGFIFQPKEEYEPSSNFPADLDSMGFVAMPVLPTIVMDALLSEYDQPAAMAIAEKITDGAYDPDEVREKFSADLFFMLGFLPLLNTKSGVSRTVVPRKVAPPGLGKKATRSLSRSKYTVISLFDREDVDSEGNITPRKLAAAHKVRGHFKCTKTGIFWWRPHVRGHGELQEREAYIVNP